MIKRAKKTHKKEMLLQEAIGQRRGSISTQCTANGTRIVRNSGSHPMRIANVLDPNKDNSQRMRFPGMSPPCPLVLSLHVERLHGGSLNDDLVN